MSIYDRTVPPTAIGNMQIGRADISGAGAKPSGFIATKHELEQVAKYWLHQQLDNDFYEFTSQSSGSFECGLARYSTHRLNAIADVLGADRLAELTYEVIEGFKMAIDPTVWEIFAAASPDGRSDYFKDLELDD